MGGVTSRGSLTARRALQFGHFEKVRHPDGPGSGGASPYLRRNSPVSFVHSQARSYADTPTRELGHDAKQMQTLGSAFYVRRFAFCAQLGAGA
jgi:hypothetical protein